MKEKNIDELKKLIQENNADAIYEMGQRYFIGKDIEKDYEKALMYYRKSSDLGNIKGLYGIAKCYYYGKGVEQNYEKAFNIFNELSLKHDDIDSKYYIAKMYYKGFFVEKNYEKAFELFYELMDKYNDSDAAAYIIEMYYYGRGTEKNYTKVIELGEGKFKHLNNSYIENYLGEIYYFGKEVEKNYQKATEHFSKGITTDDNSYFYLASIYENGGYGIYRDLIKANEYYHKIEEDLCHVAIYYVFSKYGYESDDYANLITTLNYPMKELVKYTKHYPKNHPFFKYFNRLEYLEEDQYRYIANRLKNKIEKYYSRTHISLFTPVNENDVSTIVTVILDSYNYDTFELYLNDETKKEHQTVSYLFNLESNDSISREVNFKSKK